MRNNIWNKRIPTLLGLILILGGIVVTSIMVKSGVVFISRASPSVVPQNIRITNVQDTSFTITYATDDAVIGSVAFGEGKDLGQNALDDRDRLANSISPQRIHNITITNLRPATTYFFSIVSGQNTFLNKDEPFSVTTGATITQNPPLTVPITGTVVLPTGSKPDEAVVYATVDGAQAISTLTKPDGSYILPLNSLRANGLYSYFSLNSNSIIKMLIVTNSLRSNVLLSKGQTNVPTVTLSKDYDFTVSNTPIASSSAGALNLPLIGFPQLSTPSGSKSQTPQILTPKKDEGFSDQQPQFKGTALPNQTVKITIHSSENIQTNVTTNSSGSWSYRPDKPLSPGEHTITVETKDAAGILKILTQSFTVYASGTKVAESATPSGTLAPSPTSTPALTPTSSPRPTPPPIPTATPTIVSPTPTIISSQPKNNIPPTGPSNILVAGIIGIGVTLIGGLLFLLTRGKNTPL